MKLSKLIFSSLILSTSASYAGTMGTIMTETSFMKEGLYLGAGIGGAMYNDKIKAFNTLTFAQQEKSFNTSSALASVFIGVGKTWCDKYFLGLEANTYFPHHTTYWPDRPGVTKPGYFFEDKYVNQNYINLDMLPGYRLNSDWLVYGRAGISFSDIFFYQAANSAANESSQANTITVTGGRFGAGINYQISEHIGAGVDYFYSYIPNIDSSSVKCHKTQNFYSNFNYIGFSLFYTV